MTVDGRHPAMTSDSDTDYDTDTDYAERPAGGGTSVGGAIRLRRFGERTPVQIVSTLLRLGLGGVWLAAGVLKIGDPDDMVRSVRAFRILPEALVEPVAFAVPFVEVALGALLVVGLAVRAGAVVSTVLSAIYVSAIASAAARGLRIDCGCFSSGGDLTAEQPTQYTSELVRDGLLLAASALLAVWPRGYLAVDRLLDRPTTTDGGSTDEFQPTEPTEHPERQNGKNGPNRTDPRRQKIAAARAAQAARQRRKRRIYVAVGVLGVLLIAAIVGIAVQTSRNDSGPVVLPVTATGDDDGIVVGDPAAPVTLDVYEDFQCPNCGQLEQASGDTINQLVQDSKAKVVYHVMSFLGPESERAANAAAAAADQDKFAAYHAVLFAQPAPGANRWLHEPDADRPRAAGGPDVAGVRRCGEQRDVRRLRHQGERHGIETRRHRYADLVRQRPADQR